jgi:predicted transcriptional regulator
MKTLTKAEEQVMHAVWKLKEGFIRDIIETLPLPNRIRTRCRRS